MMPNSDLLFLTHIHPIEVKVIALPKMYTFPHVVPNMYDFHATQMEVFFNNYSHSSFEVKSHCD